MSLLTKIAIKQRWLTFLLAGAITLASIWAVITLKVDLIPEIELPMTTIVTIHPQAAPEEIVDQITIPVEDTVSEIEGLKHLISTSADGMSLVLAEFEYGTDMSAVNAIIKQNLATIDLPPEVRSLPEQMPQIPENPQLVAINLSMMPLVIFSLSSDVPPDELQDLAEREVLPGLEEIDGVYLIEVMGGERDKVLISPDPEAMNRHEVSISQIISSLAGQEYASEEAVRSVSMGTDSVILADVAGVTIGPPPRTAVSRTNGKPSLTIMVMKEAEANTVEVANAVVAEAERIAASLGHENEVELLPVFDQSAFIEESVTDLTRETIVGGVLAILIVFLFLMVFRASLIIAISIPLSLLIGFLVMRFWGITINILTLSAMAIAVGRVIDDSIVLLEVIYRYLQEGVGFKEAAMRGAKEVATPITSATLATVAIFLPLAFVGGIVGEMFVPFALTITFALLASLLVSLTIVPALSGLLVPKSTTKKEARESWYLRLYTPTLRWALSHRALTLFIAIVIFIGSLALVPVVGTSFLPNMSEKMMLVQIEMPQDTGLSATRDKAIQVEQLLAKNSVVDHYYTSIGTSSSVMGAFGALMGAGDNTGEITVMLDPRADLDKEVASLRRLSEPLGPEITVLSGTGLTEMIGTGAMEISVQGDNFDDINTVTRALFDELSGMSEVTNLDSETAEAKPKLYFEPNMSKAMSSGLSMEQLQKVQEEFLLIMRGSDVPQSILYAGNESYQVYLGEIGEGLDMIEKAEALRIGWPQSVPLEALADVSLIERPSHIQRIDQRLSAQITGTITAKNVGAVNREIEDLIDNLPRPESVDIKMGGVAEEMQETFSAMLVAIIAAIVISFAILLIFMRSVLNPLIIMVSLPLASIGALLGLLIAGYPIGASASMGILMLVGIVLTNAIVLVTLVDQLRKDGMNTRDAIMEAGRTRIRPILMTALTTMIALVPLALGVGSGVLLASELAIVVIGGLFSSTLLTLLVIPVIYSLVAGIRERKQRA